MLAVNCLWDAPTKKNALEKLEKEIKNKTFGWQGHAAESSFEDWKVGAMQFWSLLKWGRFFLLCL